MDLEGARGRPPPPLAAPPKKKSGLLFWPNFEKKLRFYGKMSVKEAFWSILGQQGFKTQKNDLRAI
jgi:hypothetical protein